MAQKAASRKGTAPLVIVLRSRSCSVRLPSGSHQVRDACVQSRRAVGLADIDKPTSALEYSTKAGHLIGLLPREAPLFVGFQEIGDGDDLAALAHSCTWRIRN